MKKLFNHYADDKISQNSKTIPYRNLIKFCEQFNLFQAIKGFDKSQLQIIYYKVINSSKHDFQTFIELLYKIQNFNQKQQKKTDEKELAFKNFLDEFILPKFKILFSKITEETAVERVQVFYQNYNPYENPTVCLLYENDDLLKHVIMSFYYIYLI